MLFLLQKKKKKKKKKKIEIHASDRIAIITSEFQFTNIATAIL